VQREEGPERGLGHSRGIVSLSMAFEVEFSRQYSEGTLLVPLQSSRLLGAIFMMFAISTALPQRVANLNIDTTKALHPVSPMLYGLMTEEINHSYDGGLYAQLLSNHTFRTNFMGMDQWGVVRNGDAKAAAGLDKTTGPSTALPTSVKLTVEQASSGNEAGLSNPGYWGIPSYPRSLYHGELYAKTDLDSTLLLRVQLIGNDTGAVLATSSVNVRPGPWQRYEYTLTTSDLAPSASNHIEFTFARPGTLWMQLVTLFPPTYNNRPNGNRIDLTEKMVAMHPHFLRLPGGNYLEGNTLKDWYDWRKTIGPLVDRPGHQAPWSYWSTDGLGLLEFLEWCDELHVEPVLAVYAGYALQHAVVQPGKDLEPYVQAALDEVEYVTGDVSTKWGAERAKNGHPKPFPLTHIEIGNEDWFDKTGSYDGRFEQFAKALRMKYPQYKLIATTQVKVSKAAEPDVIDDHYYESPAEMFDLVHKYDGAPRDGMKVFVGEWATRSGSPTPNFGDALGDAAWMTSLERNSDLIVMASYAPLLVNVNPGGMQWPTDLIGFDALKSYGSPSYYAQCLFAAHLGDQVVQSSIDGGGDRFFYSATVSSGTKTLHLKLVNASNHPQALDLNVLGAKAGMAKLYSLHAASYQATNSVTEPEAIKPVESAVKITGLHTVPAYTIQVVDIPLR
jgi:alpha-N-arabinofuranosidase